jgi:hypothetical protein
LHHADLPRMRQKIDWVLQQGARSLREFTTELQKEGIELIIGQNKTGSGYELTFVDNQLLSVAHGSDLGNAYGAESILKGIATGQSPSLSPGQQHIRSRITPSISKSPSYSPCSCNPTLPSATRRRSFRRTRISAPGIGGRLRRVAYTLLIHHQVYKSPYTYE